MQRSPLVRRFAEVVRDGGERIAIEDDRESVSFALLGERVLRVAADLHARGLEGKRVAMLVTQGSRWVEAFLGIMLADAIAVPLSPLHPETEQAWFVEVSHAAAIVVSDEMAERVRGYAGSRPVLRIEALRENVATRELAETRPDDIGFILYTSGTTGKPKGALISQGNLEAVARLLAAAWQWSESDVLLHCLPLHHLHGLGIALFTAFLAGGKTRLIDKFDAARMWEAMGECTVLMGVPTMHKKLLDALDAADAETRARWQQARGGAPAGHERVGRAAHHRRRALARAHRAAIRSSASA